MLTFMPINPVVLLNEDRLKRVDTLLFNQVIVDINIIIKYFKNALKVVKLLHIVMKTLMRCFPDVSFIIPKIN